MKKTTTLKSKGKRKKLLRKCAEELLTEKSEDSKQPLTGESAKLIHELRVHQIELEMQNEELRRAQVEIQESQKKYSDLYDFAPVGYFTLNKISAIEWVNLTGAVLLGVERKHLTGKPFYLYIHKESDDAFYSYRQLLLNTGTRQTRELRMVKKGGTPFYAQLEGAAVFDEGGGLDHFNIAVLDVTERKRAEETLRDNLVQLSRKNRYETIIRAVTQSVHRSINLQEVMENAVDSLSKNAEKISHIGIYMVEGEATVLKAHMGLTDEYIERAERIPYPKGFTWKTIIEGKPLYCPDTEKDTVMGPAGRKLGTNSYLSMPIRYGGKIVGSINIHSLEKDAFDEEELKLLENVAHQIEVATSNAKQAELLHEGKERYRALVENTDDLVNETSIDGRFLYVSPRHKDVLGYEPDELLGRDIFEHVHPDDRPAVAAEFYNGGIEDSESGQAVFRYRHKNGQWLWLESRGKAFKTATGEIRVVINSRDITERRKLEEEVLKVQKLESLGILAGGIAHDFNNVLTAVLGNISLAKLYVPSEDKTYTRLTEAEKACRRAGDLVQRFITFSKGGAPTKRTTPIGKLIEDSTNLALRGANVKGEFSIAEDLYPVEVDGGKISQVIHNLVTNARQAMPGGGAIKVTAENTSRSRLPVHFRSNSDRFTPEDKFIKITVADEGIGIPEEQLSKVFDPYFTTKQKGSGLGLAVSYSIIKSHDGYIGVESRVGVGTEFFIYLPSSSPPKESPAGKPPERAIASEKGKILVMDDEEVVRDFVGEVLKQMGREVELAKDGTEALELYTKAKDRGEPFDVVILDLTVPGAMGGKETVKRLLRIEPNLRAIVSSGYSNDSVMSEYGDYGFKGVVTKPYKIQELIAALQRVMDEE